MKAQGQNTIVRVGNVSGYKCRIDCKEVENC